MPSVLAALGDTGKLQNDTVWLPRWSCPAGQKWSLCAQIEEVMGIIERRRRSSRAEMLQDHSRDIVSDDFLSTSQGL